MFMFEDYTVMVDKYLDFYVFALADTEENELMLQDLLSCLSKCINGLKAKTE